MSKKTKDKEPYTEITYGRKDREIKLYEAKLREVLKFKNSICRIDSKVFNPE